MSLVRAREGFMVAAPKGHTRGRVVNGGEVCSTDDPVVVANPHLFEPIDEAAIVEKATAAPGELRALTPKTDKPRQRKAPAKKAPAKKAPAKKAVARPAGDA